MVKGSYVSYHAINDLFDEVQQLYKIHQSVLDVNFNWSKDKFIKYNTDGGIIIAYNPDYKLSGPVRIKKGSKFIVNSGGENIPYICECDEYGNLVKPLLIGSSNGNSSYNTYYDYTTTEDRYIRVCYKYTIKGAFISYLLEGKNTLEYINNALNNDIYTNWEYGKFVSNASTLLISDNESYKLSAPVKVTNSDCILINSAGANVPYICKCDKDGTLLKALLVGDANGSSIENKFYKYIIPEDCYVRVCYKFGIKDSYAKLVKKDSIFLKVNSFLENEVPQLPNVAWENGKFISNIYTMLISNNDSYKLSSAIPIKKGDIIVVNSAGVDIPFICECDNVGTLTKVLMAADGNATTTNNSIYYYLANKDCYVRITYKYGLYGSFVKYIPFGTMYNSFLINVLGNVNCNLLADWDYGKFIANPISLLIQDNTEYKISDIIDLYKGDTILINSAGANIAYICKCDEEGNLTEALFIGDENGSSTENKLYKFSVKDNCKAKVCFKYRIKDSYVKIIRNDSPVVSFSSSDNSGEGIKKHLRILLLGNSYTADSWMYVPFILKEYGITCEIEMYYRGALTLENLVNRWETNAPYDYEIGPNFPEGQNINRQLYYIDTRNQSTWLSLAQKSAKDCVAEGNWDIISIQQWSGLSIDIDSFYPYGPQVIELIRRELPNQSYNLAWNMVCTRPTNDDKETNLSVAEQWTSSEPFTIIFPYGTAVFNCRSNDNLAQIGDSDNKNYWCGDNVHIQEGLPKYTASLAVVQALFNKYYSGLSVLGDKNRPDASGLQKWNIHYEIRGTSVGITDENCYLAQKAAILANRFNFKIIKIADIPSFVE